MTRKTIVIGRPRLVSFLLTAGIEVSPPQPNPWNSGLKVWTVPDTPEVRKLIDRFMSAARAEEAAE